MAETPHMVTARFGSVSVGRGVNVYVFSDSAVTLPRYATALRRAEKCPL